MSRVQTWIAARTPWQRRGLALAAGAAATLGQAPFQLSLVFVLAIVVLVWLIDSAATRPKKIASSFALGWFFAFGHMASGLYWVSSAFNADAQAWGPIWGIPATAALAAGMALYWGAGCALAAALWTNDVRRIVGFAACIFASEWLRGNLFGGFPWLLPGYVWTPGEPISQFASVAGIYGLTLLTLLIAAAPAAAADGQSKPAQRFAPLVVAALIVGMGWGWGAQRIAQAPVEPPGARPVVRVADSGMSQAEKWENRPNQEERVLRRYLDASGPPDDRGPSILVWPEGAIPVVNFFMLENDAFMRALARGLGDRVLVTGLTRRELRSDGVAMFNSAAVIDGVSGQPRLGQIYDKHRLVPFGEFIPLWSLVSSLNIAPLQRIGAGFESGDRPARLIIHPDAPPAVALICYEAIFPGMVPHGDERPGWIISVTNDAWFGDGTGPYQHYAMARYRTIEEGLPMARAASGGISGIIDAYGREVRATHRRGGSADAQIPPSLSETTMAKYGNILLVLLLVIVVGLRFLPPGRVGGGRKA